MRKPDFIERLERGERVTLVVYGTSLSFHLAPILRPFLEKQYGDRVQVVNSGLAGRASRTALQLLDDKVIRHRPDALLMEWAVNDAHDYFHEPDALDAGVAPDESRRNLETLVERVQAALPKCEILLWTTNPTFDASGSTMRSGSARPDLNLYYQGVREVAWARGLRVIDAETFWDSLRVSDESDFRALIPDGAHPTPKALRERLVPFLMREWGVSD